MGKKQNEKLNELFELATAQKNIKAKKKAIQFECCHKDRKGNFALKPTGKDYVFKCKLCKDKKVDLRCVDAKRGTINEQLKEHYRGIKSIIDLAKLQSNQKDEKLIESMASTLKRVWTCIAILKKTVGNSQKMKKKKNGRRSNITVTSGGKSLFGR